MTRTIVIGDTHGDFAGLLAILRATGGIDAEDRRLPDTRVIQLGDLIHGGVPRHAPREGVDDGEALRVGLALCDTILIGNHELSLVWPDAGFPTWGGQAPLSAYRQAKLLDAYARGVLVPATSVGDWLLTHAGLHPDLKLGYAELADDDVSAERASAMIGDYFRIRVKGLGRVPIALTDGVSALRGGRHPEGGIFWCDWRELSGATSAIPQIFGHTPQGDAPGHRDNLWCVDCGAALSGKVCAIVSDDDGANWTPVVVESESGNLAS